MHIFVYTYIYTHARMSDTRMAAAATAPTTPIPPITPTTTAALHNGKPGPVRTPRWKSKRLAKYNRVSEKDT